MPLPRLKSDSMDQALTVKEVALLLQVDEKTVYRLTQKGDLPGFKVAGSWRFKGSDMDEWVERQKTAATMAVKGNRAAKKKGRQT